MPATTEKPPTLAKELAALERMTATELREKYAAVFGEPAASGNRAWLARRVGWRMQALAEGDMSERARARAAELARDADLRLSPPMEQLEPASTATPNLNTHCVGSLYEAFPPAEAHRLAERIEWHYTPRHGSWLNMAEIELSVLVVRH